MSDEPDVEVVPPIKGSDRTKAARIRARVRVKAPLSEEDARWLNDYETRNKDFGASASHKVSFTEESTAAVGTGTAAEVAAATALAREDGRRLDAILDRSMRFMEGACLRYEKMLDLMLQNRMEDSAQIRALLNAYHDNSLDKTELEVELMKAQNGDPNDANAMLMQLLQGFLASKGNKPPKLDKK